MHKEFDEQCDEMVMIDGSTPETGETIIVDSQVTTFTVKISSTKEVGSEELRDLIQTKWKVEKISMKKRILLCLRSVLSDM